MFSRVSEVYSAVIIRTITALLMKAATQKTATLQVEDYDISSTSTTQIRMKEIHLQICDSCFIVTTH
jgi:hypothetical protein